MVVRFGCGLLLTVLVVVSVLAVVYLPTWAAGLTIAVCLVAAGFLVRSGMRWLVNAVFEAKSKALLDARAEAHRIDETERPAEARDRQAPEPAASGEASRYLLMEVTITPSPEVDPPLPWEPHELLLVPFDREVSPGSAAPGSGDDPETNRGSVHSARLVAADGQTSEAAPDQLTGEQRLQLVFACPPGLGRRVKLQYYFTSLGDFRTG